ncbi:hypothetical protein Glove_267g37 [Diversispora epigaea]|uniref:HMG box domain-containing protein n=1 Tax=Diversispora epigaea TaxID=1348612 RepID=A0A397IC84_9GLOM|nr:hypothetical protein Glove_267g37 [Diversispora epigaea]
MLLENINRNNIYPPPEINEPIHNHSRCHAYKIFRYSVAKECKRIGEFNAIFIHKVADHLWKNSTSNEKLEYNNLAQMVRSR